MTFSLVERILKSIKNQHTNENKLTFDTSHMSVNNPIQQISLSSLCREIESTIEDRFHNRYFWIVADISNHSFREQKGHHYFQFTEKDSASNGIIAKMSAVAWKDGHANILKFESSTGQKFTQDIRVLAKVSVSYHSEYGMKLILLDLDHTYTLGEIERRRLQILDYLVKKHPNKIYKSELGYSTPNSRLKLPFCIQRLAVVSSQNSAGLQDFVHTLQNNQEGYSFQLDFYYSEVQGENNAKKIRDKFIDIYNSNVEYDAIIMVRGGGAQTDFLIFDTLEIGEAVARFPIPVIVGIGHQKDSTIADLMANVSLKTPTMVAEFLIQTNRNFESAIWESTQKILGFAQRKIHDHTLILRDIKSSLVSNASKKSQNEVLNISNQRNFIKSQVISLLKNNEKTLLERLNLINVGIIHYKQRKDTQLQNITSTLKMESKLQIDNHQSKLQQHEQNLQSLSTNFLKVHKSKIEHIQKLVSISDPSFLLKRGFTLVKKGDQIITSKDKLNTGEIITLQFKDGTLGAEIKSNHE